MTLILHSNQAISMQTMSLPHWQLLLCLPESFTGPGLNFLFVPLCPRHASFPYSAPLCNSNTAVNVATSSFPPSFPLLLSVLAAFPVGGPRERLPDSGHFCKAYSTCVSSPAHLLGAHKLTALFLDSLRKLEEANTFLWTLPCPHCPSVPSWLPQTNFLPYTALKQAQLDF